MPALKNVKNVQVQSSKGSGRRNGLKKKGSASSSKLVQSGRRGGLLFDLVEGLAFRQRLDVANRQAAQPAKNYVLDTCVLMHDPMSLFRFENNNIYMPRRVLNELNSNKNGADERARNARQAASIIENILKSSPIHVGTVEGFPLTEISDGLATGRFFLQMDPIAVPEEFDNVDDRGDAEILAVMRHLIRIGNAAARKTGAKTPSPVILVSKDRILRINALAFRIPVQDYRNDQLIDDPNLLYTGVLELPADFWLKHSEGLESWQQGGHTLYRLKGPLVASFLLNQFVVFDHPGEAKLQARVVETDGRIAVLSAVTDYTHEKNAVWGITARNREQNFFFNLLMNPSIELVIALGVAGSGKTLLPLAAGLYFVLESAPKAIDRPFNSIIMTRATISVGEDIGFLPGTEEEKMSAWMGAMEDNLEVLVTIDPESGEWGRSTTIDQLRRHIKIKSLNYMRGRTFIRKFLIIDEAQNLTPKQIKTLITRAGPGTKVIVLGNIAQIDTPYLTESSNGLAYLVDRMKGGSLVGVIQLPRGERSRLAELAVERL